MQTLFLNSARNCLRYLVRTLAIEQIAVPYYICPAIWEVLHQEHCRIKLYHLDENFYPTQEFTTNNFILYPNYFGIAAGQVRCLSKRYPYLIVDNAHAFFMPHCGIASFNSWRKFFTVNDGATLTVSKDCALLSLPEVSTAKEILLNPLDNELRIMRLPLQRVTPQTMVQFQALNLEMIRQQHLATWQIFANRLSATNELKISLTKEDVPMIYPYLSSEANKIRLALQKEGIELPRYWSYHLTNFFEGRLARYLVPLPLDGCTEQIIEIVESI